MEVMHRIIAGLDVHAKQVVACLRVQQGKQCRRTLKQFSTTTPGLLELHAWLVEAHCPVVLIESTGVYWQPVFNILEGIVEVILANAQHVKTLPGRKTDLRDAEWLAELGAHGLVRSSFIPPAPIRELRELTRYRKSLIQARSQEVNRVHKVLESANIKLGTVVSDLFGASGLAMLRALIVGEREPDRLAGLAKGSLQRKGEALLPALTGRFRPSHGFLLTQLLEHIEYLDRQFATVSEEIARRCGPFEEAVALVQTIPGVGRATAEVILAEIEDDMRRFPSAHHLASWAGLCPGNNESAGKRRTGRTRKGNRWLRTALCQAGWAASRAKGTYLQSQFRRLAFAKAKGGEEGGDGRRAFHAHRRLAYAHISRPLPGSRPLSSGGSRASTRQAGVGAQARTARFPSHACSEGGRVTRETFWAMKKKSSKKSSDIKLEILNTLEQYLPIAREIGDVAVSNGSRYLARLLKDDDELVKFLSAPRAALEQAA